MCVSQTNKKERDMEDKIKTKIGTWIRTIGLLISSINMLLTGFGKNPIPFSEEEIYTICSAIVQGVFILMAWWKNNSFTQSAKRAELAMHSEKEYLRDIKGK